jgi:hypothetical protein
MRPGVLAFLIAFGAAMPAAAQGPPYGPEDRIPVSEQKQLAAMLEIVRHAERVEALPVKVEGMGLDSEARPVEKPVSVDAASGRALQRVLARYDWSRWSPMACMFQPGVAFRFTARARSTVVLVCFLCGEMALDGMPGRLGEKKILDPADRNAFLRAAKKAFPKALHTFEEEVGEVKTKGR